MYATCRQVQDNTTILAEVMAMKEGCDYCVENQFLSLVLETDSLALTKIVRGNRRSPGTQEYLSGE